MMAVVVPPHCNHVAHRFPIRSTVGWCRAGNRHTWFGFASARGRDSTST
ncbi:DUF5701 family protein [Mycolicibacterium stellerae]